jgi:hypothetical protein
MVGRRKVIASRHRRPISLPPTLGFLAGLEHWTTSPAALMARNITAALPNCLI